MFDSARVEGGRATNDAVDGVTLCEQQFRQVAAVLACDSLNLLGNRF